MYEKQLKLLIISCHSHMSSLYVLESEEILINTVGGCDNGTQQGVIAEEVRKALQQSANPGDARLIFSIASRDKWSSPWCF